MTIGADQLVLLSDVDGLYTGNPHTDATARRLEFVPAVTPEIEAMAGDPVSGLSKGGTLGYPGRAALIHRDDMAI